MKPGSLMIIGRLRFREVNLSGEGLTVARALDVTAMSCGLFQEYETSKEYLLFDHLYYSDL